jgi:hypothetical protein
VIEADEFGQKVTVYDDGTITGGATTDTVTEALDVHPAGEVATTLYVVVAEGDAITLSLIGAVTKFKPDPDHTY